MSEYVLPLELIPERLLGKLEQGDTATPIDGATWYTAHTLGDGLAYTFPVGALTGAQYLTADMLQIMRAQARAGANSMADDLQMTRPAAVTTVKPSGTLSKVMDCAEGIHRPLGKYIFNHVEFSRHSGLPQKLSQAGYHVIDHPTKSQAVLVRFPVAWDNSAFDRLEDGREVNREPAVEQLDRYLKLLKYWSDHNVSCTISYDADEVPQMIEWFERNWDEYVAVSFLFRANPETRAEELGYAYLPQEVVSEEEHKTYVSRMKEVDLDEADIDELHFQDCITGACPAR